MLEASRKRPYILGLSPGQLHELWRLKQRTGEPITAHVREAVRRYLTDLEAEERDTMTLVEGDRR
jgi:hypothetical protein